MVRDDLMRRVLWASAIFNLGGALSFAFPSSFLGQLAGLPSPVPLVYRAIVALFIVLFGAAYAWLALQPRIDRPLIGLAAVGKASVFMLISVLWLFDQAPVRAVALASGDFFLACVFVWWLVTDDRRGGIR